MSARPNVTITLGRSGQVVKRSPISDVTRPDHERIAGSKRPIRERLGNNVDDPHSYNGKRRDKRQHKEDHHNWSSSDDDMEEGKQYAHNRRVSRDDLRFKLIHKSLSKRSKSAADERNGVDLRDKLSRNSHSSIKYGTRRPVPESRSSGFIRRIPPTRSADDLLQLDSSRKTYSCSLDRLRHRSPDRLIGASRGMSPPRRNYEDMRHDLQHVSSTRSLDPSRPTNFTMKNVDVSRPEPIMRKATVPVEAAKPVLRAVPSGGTVQKIYMSEESVPGLLHSLGLGKYAILFQAEEVDMTALKQMGDNDLKELGIPMGPRKKILLAVLPRPKHRHG
ncbi:Uncharacterized protein M6B38_227860 [Iris pallida]|uniref:SAM domain-containing protein n=1 Tax=Iris pallida TaxID=29817 RepID=A0AAX6DSU4_IRIPA|nr:Uncharacterized protein M6B38_227860 [Iris pallida]